MKNQKQHYVNRDVAIIMIVTLSIALGLIMNALFFQGQTVSKFIVGTKAFFLSIERDEIALSVFVGSIGLLISVGRVIGHLRHKKRQDEWDSRILGLNELLAAKYETIRNQDVANRALAEANQLLRERLGLGLTLTEQPRLADSGTPIGV